MIPRCRLVLLVALLAGLAAPAVCFAGASEEAERQLTFARRELEQSRYDRAITSAESALRLDPTAVDAFVLKALAYEGLGEVELAESLLIAYLEITKDLPRDPSASQALARLQSRDSPGTRNRRGQISVQEERRLGTGQVSVDIDVARARVKEAITAGNCQVAAATADEVTAGLPRLPDGWRLVGDAARCDGRVRAAALAYGRFLELGGTDPRVTLMLEGLLDNLGDLEIRLSREAGGPVALVRLELPDGESVSPEVAPDGTLTFSRLPAGTELSVTVGGRGLEAQAVAVKPLGPGEHRVVTVTPTYVGLGVLRLARYDTSMCKTTFYTADGELELAPGGAERVTAGKVAAVVQGAHGEIEVDLDLEPGQSIEFDPLPWVPTSLTIVGLPAGSTVRVSVEGFDDARMEKSQAVDLFGGQIDPATGVRVAEPLAMQGLLGGSGGLFVEHPVLGGGNRPIVLELGEVNATTFDYHALPGLEAVRLHHQRWSANRGTIQRASRGQTGAGLGMGIAGAVAAGLFTGLAVAADLQLDESAREALLAQERGDEVARLSWTEANRASVRDRTGFTIAASSGAVFFGAGIVLTVASAAQGERALKALGPWDPAALPPTGAQER